jgi:hypothetical protein
MAGQRLTVDDRGGGRNEAARPRQRHGPLATGRALIRREPEPEVSALDQAFRSDVAGRALYIANAVRTAGAQRLTAGYSHVPRHVVT